ESAGKSIASVTRESAPASTGTDASAQQASLLVLASGQTHESDRGAGAMLRSQDSASGKMSEAGDGAVVTSGRVDSQPTPSAFVMIQASNSLSDEEGSDATTADWLAFANMSADDPSLIPQGGDLITGSPAQMMRSLQTGVQNFLGELDHLGKAMIGSS